ncbi:hypothetical protein DUI87_16646 [Hirundo rustica rustica]|uniref:Retroviral nucleocapsid Gag protein p24 C-terminal domain-containing protein n=1 Tax=Hirundo rustica rustica TaxID=333673 RepID=A0A3M0K816_HIRRU|nr:hypothetical protein DUI87_16646 [Hirundo rustica rustica]
MDRRMEPTMNESTRAAPPSRLGYSWPQILCTPDSKTQEVILESLQVPSARGSRLWCTACYSYPVLPDPSRPRLISRNTGYPLCEEGTTLLTVGTPWMTTFKYYWKEAGHCAHWIKPGLSPEGSSVSRLQVTVPPRDHTRFWGDVKAKVKEMADYDSAHHPLEGRDGFSSPAGATETAVVSGSVAVPSSQASAPVPVKSMGWDLAGTAAFPGSYQPCLVLRGATHGTHQALSWEAFKELRDVVGKYGLGSAEVMQVLRGFNADVLPPYVIRYLARVLFQPVEYDIFEYKWTRLADRVVARNTALSQQDPRPVIGTDVLLGMGNFADLQRQVALDPLVLDQCQKTGMAALIQTIEMAYPKEPFVTVVQGAEEPFLQFAGRLAASVEGQVEDVNVRLLVLKDLARTNCNAECKMIIEALPGDPSLPQMVEACARTLVECTKFPWMPLILAENRLRGDSGFISSGPPQVHWTAVLTKDCPEKVSTLSIPGATPPEIHLHGLLDTDTDHHDSLPCYLAPGVALESSADVCRGVGRNVIMLREQRPVMITNPEGQTAMIWPHVTTEISTNLWGREVLATLGVRIRTDFGGGHCDEGHRVFYASYMVAGELTHLGEPVGSPSRQTCCPSLLGSGAVGPWSSGAFYQSLEHSCLKKSGKWKLLQDLWKVNAVMESTRTLQAGMPSPTMLPARLAGPHRGSKGLFLYNSFAC